MSMMVAAAVKLLKINKFGLPSPTSVRTFGLARSKRARLRILGWTGLGMGASSSTSLEEEKRREGRRALRMEKMGLEEDVEGVLSVRTESRLMRDSEVG